MRHAENNLQTIRNKEFSGAEVRDKARRMQGFPGGSVAQNSPANSYCAGDTGSIPGSGRSPGGGHGDTFQYSCLENPMDRGAWQATVHGVAKNHTQVKQLSTWAHIE